ncbi:hypothetical protein ACKC9G_09800 [Pokkaliibacter sp. CJK22405]|uniref:hypothetical protein n=1 Tax=Pokkaliibacter sp. CJK22405 TaxID=3384615 RepID=UPI00398497C0
MMSTQCWQLLGLSPTQDLDVIRSAYRRLLPTVHPEEDPEGFKALRAAYDEARRLANRQENANALPRIAERDIEASTDNENFDAAAGETVASTETCREPGLIDQLKILLSDTAHRFDPIAWEAFLSKVDKVSLQTYQDVYWQVLWEIYHYHPLSHQCVQLLCERFSWDERLDELSPSARQRIEAFLLDIRSEDPFDLHQLSCWPATVQKAVLGFIEKGHHAAQASSTDELHSLLSQHQCLPLPDKSQGFAMQITRWLWQADLFNDAAEAFCLEMLQSSETPREWQTYLACEYQKTGRNEQALQLWIALYRTHQCPRARQAIVALCQHEHTEWLPLLILAMNDKPAVEGWPDAEDSDAQIHGNPVALTPATSIALNLLDSEHLPLLAQLFTDWMQSGQELGLMALLLSAPEHDLQARLYRYGWCLHQGGEDLLREILTEPTPDEPLTALIVERLQVQAKQALYWCENWPIAQLLKDVIANQRHQLPYSFGQAESPVFVAAQSWFRRLRYYRPEELRRLFEGEVFDPQTSSLGSALHRMMIAKHQGMRWPAAFDRWDSAKPWIFIKQLLIYPEQWLRLLDSIPVSVAENHPFAPALRACQASLENPASLLQGAQDDALLRQMSRHSLKQDINLHILNLPRLAHVQEVFDVCQRYKDALSQDSIEWLLLCIELNYEPMLLKTAEPTLSQWLTEALQQAFPSADHTRLLKEIRAHKGGYLRKLIHSAATNTWSGTLNQCSHYCLDDRKAKDGKPGLSNLKKMLGLKMDSQQAPALRLALNLRLVQEQTIIQKLQQQPTISPWKFWKEARVGRVPYAIAYVLIMAVGTGVFMWLPDAMVPAMLMMIFPAIGITWRRLRDLGLGLKTFLAMGTIAAWFKPIWLCLLFMPGEGLPNAYGPGSRFSDEELENLQACLLELMKDWS